MIAEGVSTIAWPAGPRCPPSPGDREVHIWCASLDVPDDTLAGLAAVLSEDERARASRFRIEPHRRRWTVARGTLRTLLGRYLDVAPAALRFATGSEGKPALCGASRGDLRFNVAHSDAIALYAVTAIGEVGVDVERIQEMPDADLIAESHFAEGERAMLRALPPADSAAGFFNCWTRKEAWIKAIGRGLSIPLAEFEVTLAPGDACRLVHMNGEQAATAGWKLASLSPAAGYTGAMAIEASEVELSMWEVA